MSTSDLEEIVYADPFRAFRVKLSSGDQYVVPNRNRVMISGPSLVIGLNDDPKARSGTRLKLLSIPNIMVAEQLDDVPPNGGRRRRK
jgi:hypothetical protein